MATVDPRDPPIESYGVTGNNRSAALIGRDGSVDWCCLPDFDSPSVFAALLDRGAGGRFQVVPEGRWTSRQRYVPGTNVLITRFRTEGGALLLFDWMPRTLRPQARNGVFRLALCRRGRVRVRVEVSPRFDYGRAVPLWRERGGCWTAETGAHQAVLRGGRDFAAPDGSLTASVALERGQALPLAFMLGVPEPLPLTEEEAWRSLRETTAYWRKWLSLARCSGPHRGAVLRSALALKMLIYEPTGAMVAAPTTSLPESPGGSRNWDYRYSWVRDTSMTLDVLERLGYSHETGNFMSWLTRVLHRDRGELQIMYGLRGERDLAERELGWLKGYGGAQPVRVGNGAYRQLQLDVFGEIVNTAWFYSRKGGDLDPEERETLALLVDQVCDRWREPDAGIWEVRGGPRAFVYSRAMCWVAADRGLLLAERWPQPPERLARWRAARAEIFAEVMAKGWSERKKSFTQSFGSEDLDASVLMIGLYGMLEPDHPRMVSTLDAVLRELGDGPLVARYRANDGLDGAEGSFLLCGFWAVDLLTRMGRLDEARARYEALLRYASPLGLFPEEADPKTGAALGNYPQALTHVGVIHSALNLARAERAARARPQPGS